MNPIRLFGLSVLFACVPCDQLLADNETDSSPSHRRISPEQAAMIAEAQGTATQTVAYRNVSIFAATEENSLVEGVTIVVDGDRIASILPTAEDSAAVPDDAAVVDGTGQFVVPGLIDSHVHLATLPERDHAETMARRYLYGGITTVRDMAGDARRLADMSRSALINEIPSPDIRFSALMAGPSFFSDPRTIMSALGTQPGEIPWLQGIDAETDLPLAVARAGGTWAGGIKIYANLEGSLVRDVIAEGRAQDIPVWTHIEVFPATIFDSVGASAVSHVCMIPLALLRPDGAAPRSAEAFSVDPNDFDVSDPRFQHYVSELAAAGTAVDATAHMYRQREAEATPEPDESDEAPPTRPNCSFDNVVSPIISTMHKAGVPIIAGTDFGAEAEDPFPALLFEMETLADVDGMTPADVIRSATINAANVLNLDGEIGTVEVGKYASLIFTTENPLADISNLRSIVLTVKRGHQYWRSDFKVEE